MVRRRGYSPFRCIPAFAKRIVVGWRRRCGVPWLKRSDTLRVGVIGLGSMGRQHVRVYDELEGVELVAVADSNPDALQRATRRRLARGYLEYREMLESE